MIMCAGCGHNHVMPKYGTSLCRTCWEKNDSSAVPLSRRVSIAKRRDAREAYFGGDVSDQIVTREAIRGALELGELTEDEALELWMKS